MNDEPSLERRARKRGALFAALLALLLVAGSAQAELEAQLVARLSVAGHFLDVEVAQSPEQREQGLMGRERLDENAGMLFCNKPPMFVCMWMKETSFPLSLVFIDEQGVILDIRDMQPNTLEPHCSDVAVPYALETNQGWFAQRGLGPGSKIEGLPSLDAP